MMKLDLLGAMSSTLSCHFCCHSEKEYCQALSSCVPLLAMLRQNVHKNRRVSESTLLDILKFDIKAAADGTPFSYGSFRSKSDLQHESQLCG